MGLLKYAFPFGKFSARTRETYVTSLDLATRTNRWSLMLELEAVRTLENGTGYWYGAAGGARGLAKLGGRVSVGRPNAGEFAHEVGHNVNLRHAPCGGPADPDPRFPHANGGIGYSGYDFRDGTLMSPQQSRDVMGYCYNSGNDWLSDYHYEKVIEYRNRAERGSAGAAVAAGRAREVLVVWGGVVDAALRLESPFRTTAAARVPDGRGPYRIEGVGRGGSTDFSFSFTPGEDKFGDKYFLFAIPVETAGTDTLDRIVLSGPEGVVTLDASDARTISIVTDPRTGRIRGMLRDWEGDLPAALTGMGALDVSTSTGPGGATRLRRH